MKKKFLLLIGFSVLLLACSSDNTSQNDNETPSTSLPLNIGNYWTYNVHNQATTTMPEFFGRDSLYIPNDTIISGVTYKKMKTLQIADGFYSGTLANNGVRIDGSKVRVSGALVFDAGLPTAITFAVSDFIILKEGAAAGQELSNTSGSFEQLVDVYPLTFDYTLKSISDGSLNSYLSDGNNYSNITKTKVILNLKITTTITISGIEFPFTVMNAQDVLVSNQYYSKDIGLVYNKTLINYTLNTIPGVTLPIEQTGSQTQEEFLDTYQVN